MVLVVADLLHLHKVDSKNIALAAKLAGMSNCSGQMVVAGHLVEVVDVAVNLHSVVVVVVWLLIVVVAHEALGFELALEDFH